jgi:hypothetical protein
MATETGLIDPLSQQLAQMEQAEEAATKAHETKTGKTASATNADTSRASDQATATGADSTSAATKGDTRATEEPPTKDKEKPADDKTTSQPGDSKFAKNQQRLEGGWKQLNERKTEADKREQTIAQREAELAKREQAVKAQAQAADKPKHSAQEYVNAAKLWEADAEEAEKAQDYDKADQLRADAKKARVYAEELRKNPPQIEAPPDPKQAEQTEALTKEWYAKAGIDFPETVKQGTEANAKLLEIIKGEPTVLDDPKGMYYASRLATAETSAARVPPMEKELGELRAKVKELEAKLNIDDEQIGATSDAGGKSAAQMSEQELEASLRRDLSGQTASHW